MLQITKLVEFLKLLDPSVENYNGPKEVILIEIDWDGSIHAFTTSDEYANIDFTRISQVEFMKYNDFKKSFPVQPYRSDSETWSNWTHEVLMHIHGLNRG